MSLIIKICGVSSEDALDAAIAAGADMVGLNFFPPSPRAVTPARAAALARRAAGRIQTVALAVDMDDAGFADILAAFKPDWLQLHGSESVGRVADVRARFGVPTMKAIGVRNAGDLAGAAAYRDVADRLVLDAKPPEGAALPGGNGATFDWRLIEAFVPGLPYLLSGGLTADNVGEAVRITRAPGVDVSSGVETAPGRKDPALIAAFIAAARAAEAAAPRQKEGIVS
jgi:phosphoribosylanthranilate isomerase